MSGREKKRLVKLGGFVMLAGIYFSSIIVGFAGLATNIIRHQEVVSNELVGACLALMLIAQLVWGVVVGLMDYRQGLRALPKASPVVNVVGLIAINSLSATPGAITVATISFTKTGQFVPYPEKR